MPVGPAHVPPESDVTELRRHLHAVNGELSVAILELELLLENVDLDPATRSAVTESLSACRQAADEQRQAWAALDRLAARP
jgi:hypothetical protein